MPRNPVRVRQALDGSQWISTRELTDNIFGSNRRTLADQSRRFFGSGLSLETIESALRMADFGYMRDLADLTKETFGFDPHLLSTVPKRFRALASVEPKLVAAEGPGVDPTKAAKYSDVVRQQLAKIPNLKQQIIRLDWAHCNGRAALEKAWKEAKRGPDIDYQFEIAELNWIHVRRLSYGPERQLMVRDDAWGGGGFELRGLDIEAIPHKFICFKPQLFDDVQEREGFGPRCLYYSFFKRMSWRDRMILLEMFGKPWKIMETDAAVPHKYTPEELDEMQERADELGANASAALGAGIHLNIANPDAKSHEAHKGVSQDCDDQISKLVLGNTRTTDAKADGLGGQQSLVHQDGETLVIAADGWGVGDILTEQLAKSIIAVNYGEDEVVNAPRIEIRYESKPDQTVEIDRVGKVFAFGLPIKIEEVYRRTGFEKPEEGDEVLTQETTPSAVPGMPGKSSLNPGVVPSGEIDPAQLPADGAVGADPALPLAASMSRSLRLSRLSKGYFSGH